MKGKLFVKTILKGILSGCLSSAVIFIVCTIYINTLDAAKRSAAYDARLFLCIVFGITVCFGMISMFIGREERKAEKLWKNENKEKYGGVGGINIAGLIDDSQGKEFCDIYGNRIKAGDDHGTWFLVFRFLFVFALFVTVSSSLILIFMLASLK